MHLIKAFVLYLHIFNSPTSSPTKIYFKLFEFAPVNFFLTSLYTTKIRNQFLFNYIAFNRLPMVVSIENSNKIL